MFFLLSLRSIEWDLEDLEETVQIVEQNPRKFRLDINEIQERNRFIEDTRYVHSLSHSHGVDAWQSPRIESQGDCRHTN